jgi:hypothetical protein
MKNRYGYLPDQEIPALATSQGSGTQGSKPVAFATEAVATKAGTGIAARSDSSGFVKVLAIPLLKDFGFSFLRTSMAFADSSAGKTQGFAPKMPCST